MVALGTLLCAIGKFVSGISGDVLRGRANFLGGMGSAAVFTTLFAVGGSLPLMRLAGRG